MLVKRNRGLYVLFIISTIILGLLSRTRITPKIIYPYLGDYLYAVMFFLIIGLFFPNKKSLSILIISLLCCFAIEAFQLYEANWIQNIRNHKIGALILGRGFLWSDIVSYTLGGITIYFIEKKYYSAKQHYNNI